MWNKKPCFGPRGDEGVVAGVVRRDVWPADRATRWPCAWRSSHARDSSQSIVSRIASNRISFLALSGDAPDGKAHRRLVGQLRRESQKNEPWTKGQSERYQSDAKPAESENTELHGASRFPCKFLERLVHDPVAFPVAIVKVPPLEFVDGEALRLHRLPQ